MAIDEQNEFFSFTVNHQAAWKEGVLQDVETHGDDGISLGTVQRYVSDYAIGPKDLPVSAIISDFAIGPCQTMYLLDAKALKVYRYDRIGARFETFSCLQGYCKAPEAIEYAHHGIIVADREGPHRLLHFAELNGQLTWCTGEQEDSASQAIGSVQPFQPNLLVEDHAGYIYAIDKTQNGIFQFDAHGRFLRVIGDAALSGKQPVAIAVSPRGSLYVLELQELKVLEFANNAFVSSFSLPLPSPFGLAVDSHGQLYMGENRKLAGIEEDRFLHRCDQHGHHQDMLSVYQGCADKILIDHDSRLYILNKETSQIFVLRLESVLYIPPGSRIPTGTYYSQAFDKTESFKLWHKLVIDASLPDNTQIEVSYFTADNKQSKIDYTTEWSAPLINPKQLLIECRKERYLWIKIVLIGSEKQSPFIRSIEAVFPRDSYLRYLPAVYQEDENSRDFLERYLSLFEVFLSSSERRIDTIARWFDADVVAGDYLRWLASWLAIAYDENWPEHKLRSLIHAIPRLYGQRGTRDGLEEMIRIYTGDRPFIVEQFQLQCAKNADLIQLLERLYGSDPYSFCVLLKPGQIHSEAEYNTVQRMVENEKPAHTNGGVALLQPWIYLDRHTYLGINSNLTVPDNRIDSGVIQRDTVLRNPTPFGQVGSSTLLGAYMVLA